MTRTERALDRASGDLLRRVPPHSVEAEQAVLAGAFRNPSVMHNIAGMLQKDDFYLPAHQIIYDAFLELFHKSVPPDIVTVSEHLKARSLLEQAGGAVFLAELTEAVVSGANAAHYAAIVRDKGLQRQLIAASAGIISNCYDASREVDKLLTESEQSIFAVSQRTTGKDFITSKDLAHKVFDRLEELKKNRETVTGVHTGYRHLDQLTAGLQPSDLIIVAARPSMGKTAFALNMAVNAAVDYDIPVCVFSLEMSMDQLMMRMLAAQARVDASLLRRPADLHDEDWANLIHASDVLSKAPLFIDDTPALSTLQLSARTRRLKAERDIGLVIVDYLQLMRTNRRTDSRELEISDISRSLKALAKEVNIPVIALSQLNREVEKRKGDDKRPMLSDLRESGAIEQDADVILFIYRGDMYQYKKPDERPVTGDAEIIIGKQRNGPVGRVVLTYHSKYTSFEEKDFRTQPSEAL
jgi:replicative DNA helicase